MEQELEILRQKNEELQSQIKNIYERLTPYNWCRICQKIHQHPERLRAYGPSLL
jgi:hypothetical protein